MITDEVKYNPQSSTHPIQMNAELKAEKAVADRVMQTKLQLPSHVIDKMKADAAREILQEQQREDGDVLGW